MPRGKKKGGGHGARRQPQDEDGQWMRDDHGRLPLSQPQPETTHPNTRLEPNPHFDGNKNQPNPQQQQQMPNPGLATRTYLDQAPRRLEEEQFNYANSHQTVNNGKRRKIFDTRDTGTYCGSSMRFPAHDASPDNKVIRQSQPAIAMGRPGSLQFDNSRIGHHMPANHSQPRYNSEVTRCKIENQLDPGYELYGYSGPVRPGNTESTIRWPPASNEEGYTISSSYPTRSHYSNSLDANSDRSGELKHLRQTANTGPHQDFITMNPQADQTGAMHPPQVVGKPNGSRLHDVDYRRIRPPFEGKVKMRKGEAALNEVTTIQSLEGDRFHEDNVCNQCGHFGHWLGDCVYPDDGGFILGCPIHNAKGHTWDDCPDAKKMSLERKIMYLILRRRNKPAIRSAQPWIALVKQALQQGLEESCWGPSVWTQEFVMKMVRGPKAGHPWLNFSYGRQLISSLPKDPETMEDPGVLVEKRLLWNQVDKPYHNKEEPEHGR
ncbi:hypothetical protein ColLi_09786 [Colletotrichum liriopes]|uniref:CCHC-type domain-containing protein n=1 Tax=Colletotrichum liriopes TaxID=708192 RepID=A0AA37GVN4_9PEZI|nr:hypothetical protein ColLi_09786 [Colletotrichum liriopes]